MSSALAKITARAKQIRRAKPSMAWSAAIKKASAEYRGAAPKKKAAVSGTRKKKAAPKKRVTKVKARTVVIAGTKKKASKKKASGSSSRGRSIGAISMGELSRQVNYKAALETKLKGLRNMIADKRHKADHPYLRKEAAKTQKAIQSVNRHITALKRSI